MSRVEKLNSEEAYPGARWDVEPTDSTELKLVAVLPEGMGRTTLCVSPSTTFTVADIPSPALPDAELIVTAEWVSVYMLVLLTGTEAVLEARGAFTEVVITAVVSTVRVCTEVLFTIGLCTEVILTGDVSTIDLYRERVFTVGLYRGVALTLDVCTDVVFTAAL